MAEQGPTAGDDLRRLFVYNGGFWTKPRLRRILQLAGWRITTGRPRAGDAVGVWGGSPTSWRGRWIADRCGATTVSVEDAFLRSIMPGRSRERIARRGPIGLMIDPYGLHFDPTRPSLIERLATSGEAAAMTIAARQGIRRLQALDLSKYNLHDPSLPAPAEDYVLVIDQTRGDASLMGATRDAFLRMLATARAENPGRQIVIRSHPETAAGLRPGHYRRDDLLQSEVFCDPPVSPWRLVTAAHSVYAFSSQLGYEAMLAGKRPRLFGQPFYAGWGLTDDETPFAADRRGRASIETLFAASHLLAPVWYDPCGDRLADFDTAVDQLEAEVRAFREDRGGHLAYGMRLWKRRFIAQAFGDGRGVRFTDTPSASVTLAWANRAPQVPHATRVEDGFLRSRGLGAALTPPLSLVADDLGIYYDPSRPSRLEQLIAAPPPDGAEERASRLIRQILDARLSKYNLEANAIRVPSSGSRTRILVPGQVEDDASIRLGAGRERTNLELLRRVRDENPQAFIVFKPHPDVEAGLRPGAVADSDLAQLSDLVARQSDPLALLDQVDCVWTITSTLGFEALLRRVPVTTLGAPFYAGWGLTRDLGPAPTRRVARPSLNALVYACLVAYPRYRDPRSGLPCPAEAAVNYLRDAPAFRGGPALRVLSKVQGAFAGMPWLWRR